MGFTHYVLMAPRDRRDLSKSGVFFACTEYFTESILLYVHKLQKMYFVCFEVHDNHVQFRIFSRGCQNEALFLARAADFSKALHGSYVKNKDCVRSATYPWNGEKLDFNWKRANGLLKSFASGARKYPWLAVEVGLRRVPIKKWRWAELVGEYEVDGGHDIELVKSGSNISVEDAVQVFESLDVLESRMWEDMDDLTE